MKRCRARDLGVPLLGLPGILNAITDVPGVEVGHCTRIEGQNLRSGVTVILPQGKALSVVPAGSFVLNGNGEMTGTAWIEEAGLLEGPIGLTNTCSVGLVRDSLRRWLVEHFPTQGLLSPGLLPVVAETWDGYLNDIEAQQLVSEDVFAALDSARGGPVPEGAVGGGTGMICFEYKAGIGTSSRQLQACGQPFQLGVLVQANFGKRENLLVGGLPLGQRLAADLPRLSKPSDGSIIGILATNAPLLPQQLKRLARRMSLGLARTGGMAYNSSGDLFLAFSTACPVSNSSGLEHWQSLPARQLDPLFEAAVYATEEAILNALCMAEPMKGLCGHEVAALPLAQLKATFDSR